MTDLSPLSTAQPSLRRLQAAARLLLTIGLAGAGLSACVVAPMPAGRPVVVNPGPVYVAPSYPSPGIGWVWVEHPRYGWGWHHPEHGWHRGWR